MFILKYFNYLKNLNNIFKCCINLLNIIKYIKQLYINLNYFFNKNFTF